MVVVQALGVSLGARGVAELDILKLLGGLDDIVLVAKGVGKDDLAASISELGGGVVALLALGDVGLDHVVAIGDAQVGAGLLGGVDEVEVVGGVLIMQADKADLKIRRSSATRVRRVATRRAAGCQTHCCGTCRTQAEEVATAHVAVVDDHESSHALETPNRLLTNYWLMAENDTVVPH